MTSKQQEAWEMDACRAAFEATLDNSYNTEIVGSYYQDRRTQWTWEGWRGCWKAIKRDAEGRDELKLEWRDGYPPHPWDKEWFIALTAYGTRVVLKALPEEYAYDFKTADDTYINKEKIAKWMQFPDSQYIAPQPAAKGDGVESAAVAKHPLVRLLYDLMAAKYTEPRQGWARIALNDAIKVVSDALRQAKPESLPVGGGHD